MSLVTKYGRRPDELAKLCVDHIGTWVGRLTPTSFAFILLTVAVLRIGVLGTGVNFTAFIERSAEAFPRPAGTSSLGSILLMKALGVPPPPVWWIVGGLLFGVTVVGVFALSRRAGAWRKAALMVVALSPAFITQIALLGHYDWFLITGSLLIVLARDRIFVAAGILLAVMGNPEQAVIASICLLAVAVGMRVEHLRVRAFWFAGAAVSMFCAGQIWFARGGQENVRVSGLLNADGATVQSIRGFLASWPVTTYSFLGGLWIVVLLSLLVCAEGSRRILVLVGVILIPASAAVLTLDGTRVFAATGTAALVALLATTWERHWRHEPPTSATLGTVALLLVFAPAIVILPDDSGQLRLPYDEMLRYLGWS